MSSITSIGSSTSSTSVDNFVKLYTTKEQSAITNLTNQQSDLTKRLAIYNDLNSYLTALRDRVKNYLSSTTSPLSSARTATSSKPEIFTADAQTSADVGVHSLFVERLASYDTGISKQFTNPATSTALATQYNGTTQTFRITIGSGTPVELQIAFNDPNETDESVLKRIKEAINGAGLAVTANYVKDSSSTARLTITSSATGNDNSIKLENVGSSTLMRTMRYLASGGGRAQYGGGTGGGFIQQSTANLDSKFTLDGIAMTRGSNVITDALDGVTLKLVGAQASGAQAETLTIAMSTTSFRAEIDKFIQDYNKAIQYLNDKTKVDSVTYERGALANDFSMTNLKWQLRDSVSRQVSGSDPNAYSVLASIGIDLDRQGVMSVKDEKKLTNALETNPSQVIGLFTSTNGIAQRLQSALNRYVQTGGYIDINKRAVNNKNSFLKNQLNTYQQQLAVKEDALRQQYTTLQKSYSALSSQQTMLDQISSLYSSSSSSSSSYSY